MFFPLLKIQDFDGFLDLTFQGPNNWENRDKTQKILHLIWSADGQWNSKVIETINFGQGFRLTTDEVGQDEMQNGLAFVYPSNVQLPTILEALPSERTWVGDVPAWRATSGLMNDHAQVSYQAEVDPLPNKASMLTFHPFIQFGDVINYLLVLNLRKDPLVETSTLEIYNSYTKEFVDSTSIKSNSLTLIPLDKYGFKPTDLPLFVSNNLAGIPFGFGVHKSGKMLSLEHTHPPASFALFGDRRKVQSQIKSSWMSSLGGTK